MSTKIDITFDTLTIWNLHRVSLVLYRVAGTLIHYLSGEHFAIAITREAAEGR